MLLVLSPFVYEADGGEPKPGLWIALYLSNIKHYDYWIEL